MAHGVRIEGAEVEEKNAMIVFLFLFCMTERRDVR